MMTGSISGMMPTAIVMPNISDWSQLILFDLRIVICHHFTFFTHLLFYLLTHRIHHMLLLQLVTEEFQFHKLSLFLQESATPEVDAKANY